MRLVIAAVLSVLALAGCASTQSPPREALKVDASFETVWPEAVKAVEDMGWTLEGKDYATGTITARGDKMEGSQSSPPQLDIFVSFPGPPTTVTIVAIKRESDFGTSKRPAQKYRETLQNRF